MLALLQGAAMVLFLTYPKSTKLAFRFYLPSLLIAWGAYLAYEIFYLPAHCTGECNIRVDLLFIFPYLAFVTICAIAYFAKESTADDGESP